MEEYVIAGTSSRVERSDTKAYMADGGMKTLVQPAAFGRFWRQAERKGRKIKGASLREAT